MFSGCKQIEKHTVKFEGLYLWRPSEEDFLKERQEVHVVHIFRSVKFLPPPSTSPGPLLVHKSVQNLGDYRPSVSSNCANIRSFLKTARHRICVKSPSTPGRIAALAGARRTRRRLAGADPLVLRLQARRTRNRCAAVGWPFGVATLRVPQRRSHGVQVSTEF